jgi:hypothetical protein
MNTHASEVVAEFRKTFPDFVTGYNALMAIPGVSHRPFHHFGIPEADEGGHVRARAEASLLYHQRTEGIYTDTFETRGQGGVSVSVPEFFLTWHQDSDGEHWRFSLTLEVSSEKAKAYQEWADANKWYCSLTATV